MKNEKGITLIALVVTVIVMLILAGVAITTLINDGGLFDKTLKSAEAFENASQKEAKQLEDLMNEIDGYIGEVSKEPSTPTKPEPEEPTEPDKLTAEELKAKTNGSWDGTINTPKLPTGMIPIYWNESGQEIELTSDSLRTEWNSWYSYTAQTGTTATAGSGTSKWANAVTKDNNGNVTGYWVWIPRYEYKLTASTKVIDVNFVPISATASDGYKLHPAFINDTEKGGWSSELPGFWIAKYPAGYQKGTVDNNGNVINSSDTVVYSDLKYTNPGSNFTNVLGENITTSNYSTLNMSYPVFKPLTYVYSWLNIDGMYRISQDMKNATTFYGLSNKTDSHLMKNSEWGAVAYLAWSKYGRNATKPNINNVNLNNKDNKNIYAVTGIFANGVNTADTNGLFEGNLYNTAIGQLGSTTGNITGVYDMSGCVWEYVTGYINNTNGANNRKTYGESLTAEGVDKKYITIYLHNATSDNRANNWLANDVSTRYGDAIKETATSGENSTSWNSELSNFSENDHIFLLRGGGFTSVTTAGFFSFSRYDGTGNGYRGFRVCLVDE